MEFLPVIQAALFRNPHSAILASGSSISGVGGDLARHAGIAGTFNQGILRYNRLHSPAISNTTGLGNFLLGAIHAARFSQRGYSTQTTTQLLVQAGWKIHVSRVVVSVGSTLMFPDKIDLEALDRDSSTRIDLIRMMARIGGSQPFFVPICTGTPFGRLKLHRTKVPFGELFDSLLYLPKSAVF